MVTSSNGGLTIDLIAMDIRIVALFEVKGVLCHEVAPAVYPVSVVDDGWKWFVQTLDLWW